METTEAQRTQSYNRPRPEVLTMEMPVLIVLVVLGLYLLSSIKILPEYERGVIFRLGRLLPEAKGPGIFLVFAPIDKIVRISLRQEAFEVPPQDIITRDNVTLKVNAGTLRKMTAFTFSVTLSRGMMSCGGTSSGSCRSEMSTTLSTSAYTSKLAGRCA